MVYLPSSLLKEYTSRNLLKQTQGAWDKLQADVDATLKGIGGIGGSSDESGGLAGNQDALNIPGAGGGLPQLTGGAGVSDAQSVGVPDQPPFADLNDFLGRPSGGQPEQQQQAEPVAQDVPFKSLDDFLGYKPEQPSPYSGALGTLGGTPEAEAVTRPGGMANVRAGGSGVAPDEPVTKETVARAAATALERAGLPVEMAPYIAGIAINEGILQPGTIARDHWSVGGVKAPGSAGVVTVPTREVINGQSVMQTASFGKFNSMQEGMDALATFVRDSPRFGPIAKQAAQTGDYAGMIEGFRQQGYATDPNWTRQVNSIASTVPAVATQASPMPAPGQTTSAAFRATSDGYHPVVLGAGENSYWTSGGTHGGSPAADIFAPIGTPIHAPIGGTIRPMSAKLGGNAAILEGDDGRSYYMAHGNVPFASGRVERGGVIGQVGDTGNAKGTSPHLHMGISSKGAGLFDQRNGSGDIAGDSSWWAGAPAKGDAVAAAAPPAPSDRIKGVPADQALAMSGTMAYQTEGMNADTIEDDSSVGSDTQSSSTAGSGPPPRDIRGDYAPRAVEPGDFVLPSGGQSGRLDNQPLTVGDSDSSQVLETAFPPQTDDAVEPTLPGSAMPEAPASSGNPIVDLFSEMGRKLSGILTPQKPDYGQAAQDLQGRTTTEPEGPMPFDQIRQDIGAAVAEPPLTQRVAQAAGDVWQGVEGIAEDQGYKAGRLTQLNAKRVSQGLTPEETEEARQLSVELSQFAVPGAPMELRGVTRATREAVEGTFAGGPRAAERAGMPGSVGAATPGQRTTGRTISPPAPSMGIVSRAQADEAIPQRPSIEGSGPSIEGSDRYYHGTGSDFARPDPGKFDPNGLFGPGYYVTDNPKVAGGVVDEAGQFIKNNDSAFPQGYARARAQFPEFDIRTAVDDYAPFGENIRPVDVPRDLRLLDADAPADPAIVAHYRRYLEPDLPRDYSPTGADFYGDLATTLRSKDEATDWLMANGYDGIRYAGGKRIPMIDEAGAPIEHNAVVIFPESLDKIRNATAGTPGGLVPGRARDTAGQPGTVIAAGTRAVGSGTGAAYEESQREGSTPESVLRAGADAAVTSIARSGTGALVRPGRRLLPVGSGVVQTTSPELERLRRSMDEPVPTQPEGRPIANAVERFRQNVVRKLTDANVTMDEIQKDAVKGRLPAEERISALQRLNPDSAVDMQIQREIMEPLRQAGDDLPRVSEIMTLKQNIDQAAVMGRRAEAEFIAKRGGARAGQDVIAESKKVGETIRSRRAFSGSLNADDSARALEALNQELGPEKYAEMEQIAQSVIDFNKGTRDIALQGHIWPDELVRALERDYPNYSPTNITKYTNIDGPGGVPVGKSVGLNDIGLKKLTETGTTAAKEDPIAASVAARYDMMRRVKKNEVTGRFIETAKADPDLSQHVREIISREQWQKQGRKLQPGQVLDPEHLTPAQTRIGWYDKAAKKHDYLIDDWAKPLIENASPGELNAYQKFLQAWRSAVTDRSLSFTERNAPRDFIGALNTMLTAEGGATPKNVKKVIGLMAESYRDAFKGLREGTYHGTVEDYLSMGGGYQRASGRGLEERAQSVAEIARTGGVQIKNPADLYRWMTDPISEVNKRLELAPRSARTAQELGRGANPVEAVIAGRDLLPYELAGEWTRALNRWGVSFLTARVAGAMSQVRLAQKYPKTYLPTVLATTVAPAIGIEMYNRMDEDRSKAYDDVPDYMKYMGNVIMLPWAGKDVYGGKLPNYLFLPTGVVSPFSILGHSIGAAIMGKGAQPNDYAEMFNALTESMSPVDTSVGGALSSLIGPVGSTAVGLATNRDLFRKGQVATNMGDLEATRIGQGVAEGANAALSKIPVVGPGMANVRPSQVDYAIRGLTGGPGAQVLAASDLGRQRAGEASNIQDAPGVGGFISPLVGNRTGGTFSREADRIMSSDAGKAINDAGVKWRPMPVDDHIGKVGLTRAERGEVQQDTNAIFNANVANIRALIPTWDSLDTPTKEQQFRNLYASARGAAEIQLIKRYPERFTQPASVRRVNIEQQRKAS